MEPTTRRPQFTTVLVAVTLGMAIVVLLALSTNVRRQLDILGTASTDSIIWSVSQLDVEFGKLRAAILEARLNPEMPTAAVRTRFDILYSRVQILGSGDRYHPAEAGPELSSGIVALQSFLDRAVPIIDGGDAVIRSRLEELSALTNEYNSVFRFVALEGQDYSIKLAQQRREELFSTLLRLAIATVGVLTMLVALAVLLWRVLAKSQMRADRLSETSARLRTVFRTSLDAIVVADEDGRIRTANDAAVDLFKRSGEDMIGRTLLEILMPASGQPVSNVRKSLADVAETGRVQVKGLDANGRSFPVEMSLQAARLENKIIYVVFVRDISIRLEAENALVEARDTAIAAERTKSNFLAMMSHEIRTPLNGLLGSLSLLARTKLTEKQRAYVRNMDASGRVLLGHVEDVLDVTKFEAGYLQPEPERTDLRALLEEIVRTQSDLARTGNNDLSWRWDGSQPGDIATDPAKLRRILTNLVGNAVKFTRNGTIEVIASEVDRDGAPMVRIEVADTGPGIEADRLESIFEDFETSPRSHQGEQKGTGLGLGIARRFARVLGGRVGVESRVGEGSCFWLEIPLIRATDEAPEVAASPAEMEVPSRTILVAEDDPISRDVLRDMLELDGHMVVEASNGQEAVTLAAEYAYDLILLDVAMPVLDGLGASRAIRAKGLSSSAPIIAVTAHAMPEEIERFRDFGMTGALVKPIDMQRLRAVCSAPRHVGFDLPDTAIADRDSAVEVIGADAHAGLLARFDQELERVLPVILDRQVSSAERLELAHRLAGSAGVLGLRDIAEAAIKTELAFDASVEEGNRASEALGKAASDYLASRASAEQENV